MKKLFLKLFIFITIGAFFAGCNDFLEENPHSPSNAYFSSPGGATQGIFGAYHVLQLGESVERIEFYGTVCSGDAMAGGESGGNDQPSLQNMMKFITTPIDIYIPTYWNNMYQCIYRCNLILESTDAEWSSDNETRLQIRGEAYFLRAYCHMNLAVFYAGLPSLQDQFNGELKGIPYIDHILTPSEYEPSRPELNETWDHIIEDFSTAADLLPKRSEQSAGDLGRATKGAALAYKAKALVYTEQWAEALSAAEEVILDPAQEYTLMGLNGETYEVNRVSAGGAVDLPGYKYIFQPESDNCEEIIFAVQHYASHEGAYPQGQQGNLVPQYYGPRFVIDDLGASIPYYGWDFIHPTDYFIETAFEGTESEVGDEILDPRFKISVIDEGDKIPTLTDSLVYDSWAGWPTTGRSTWKYLAEPEFADEASTLGDYPQDTKKMRYADLLLLAAEAAIHTNNAAKATEYTNMVRQRARNSGNTGYPLDYDESQISLEKIYAERRVELCFEGHQFFDIIRTGRANQILKVDAMAYQDAINKLTEQVAPQQFGDNFELGKSEILPIPQAELDLNDNLTQNPGYN
jgi:starch-binding outer membrane protein, SusD/RagB family